VRRNDPPGRRCIAAAYLPRTADYDRHLRVVRLRKRPGICKVVPHCTTFQKVVQRLPASVPGRRMFDAVLERAAKDRTRKRRVRLAAVDGTGRSRGTSAAASPHVGRTEARDADEVDSHFPKVVFVADCHNHMILAAVPGCGPASDLVQFGRAFTAWVSGERKQESGAVPRRLTLVECGRYDRR
jgi:hypothetical protein